MDRFPDIELSDVFQPFVDRGYARGKLKGIAKVLLRLFEIRGVSLTPEHRAQVLQCNSEVQLNRWVDLAVFARTAAAVFG